VHTESETRLPERVEVATYFVVAEALTNAAKHPGASSAFVRVDVDDGELRVSIARRTGGAGADPPAGTGLIGLQDRSRRSPGTLVVESPVGAARRCWSRCRCSDRQIRRPGFGPQEARDGGGQGRKRLLAATTFAAAAAILAT